VFFSCVVVVVRPFSSAHFVIVSAVLRARLRLSPLFALALLQSRFGLCSVSVSTTLRCARTVCAAIPSLPSSISLAILALYCFSFPFAPLHWTTHSYATYELCIWSVVSSVCVFGHASVRLYVAPFLTRCMVMWHALSLCVTFLSSLSRLSDNRQRDHSHDSCAARVFGCLYDVCATRDVFLSL
jgi:hypothetical protein